MTELSFRTLPEIELAMRNAILSKYPSMDIIFTKDSDEDGKITYVDIIEPDKRIEADIFNGISKIIDSYRDAISHLNMTYIPRIIH